MCVVSAITDDYMRKFPLKWPNVVEPARSEPLPMPVYQPYPTGPSRAEFDALKKEVEALKELLKAAKKFDEETNQKDCEQAEKVAFMRKLGEMLGVDMSEVLS